MHDSTPTPTLRVGDWLQAVFWLLPTFTLNDLRTLKKFCHRDVAIMVDLCQLKQLESVVGSK